MANVTTWPQILSGIFPGLTGTTADKTSEETPDYNCIAYAAGEDDRWWSPIKGYYWPQAATYDMQPNSLIEAYRSIGYEVCADGSLDPSYTKIALYQSAANLWTHAAIQLSDGNWSSKLGKFVDIRHEKPEHLNGGEYGSVFTFMRRQKP